MKKITLFTRENCSNCKQVKELLKTLDFEVEEINSDENKETVMKYAPKGNWNLPLALFYDDKKLVNISTGVFSAEATEIPYKPMVELESLAYRLGKAQQEAEQAVKSITGDRAFVEQIINLKNQPEAEEDFPLVPPTIGEEDKIPCDNCQ